MLYILTVSPVPGMVDSTPADLNTIVLHPGHEAANFVAPCRSWERMRAGIRDGDRVVIDLALRPLAGRVVAALPGGRLIVRRLQQQRSGEVVRTADNPHDAARVIRQWDGFQMLGVVTGVLHVPL